MSKIKIKLLVLFSIAITTFIFYSFLACNEKSQNIIEKGNIYAENFTYLIQKDSFTPINYEISKNLIKKFTTAFSDKDLNFDFIKNKPSFSEKTDLSFYSKIDPYQDFLLCNEVDSFFKFIIHSDEFTALYRYLNKYREEKLPKPYPIELGDFVSFYQNGVEYRYPQAKGATIIEFVDKSYQINFEDGRIFYLLSDGTYFETFEDGSEIYYVNPHIKYFRKWFGAVLFSKSEKSISISAGTYTLSLSIENEIILDFSSLDKFKMHISLKIPISTLNSSENSFTLNENSFALIDNYSNNILNNDALDLNIISKILYTDLYKGDFDAENLIISKDFGSGSISFRFDPYLVVIQKDLIKLIYLLNEKENPDNKKIIIKNVLSIFLPEGIMLTNFDSQYSKSEIKLIYDFDKKKIGDFAFFFSNIPYQIIDKIDSVKLNEILNIIKTNFNWQISKPINVILPSNIYQYQSLLSGFIEKEYKSLPDSVVRDDIIITWPLLVPRYYEDKDISYFLEKEFYTILLNSIVKKMMKQQVSFYGRLPYFVEVGSGLYLSTLFDEELKKSLESIFDKLQKSNFPFDKALLVLANSESTPMPISKYLAAFSYKFVSYILSIYGSQKLTDFIRSFKIEINEKSFEQISSNESFLSITNKNINKIFGVSFEKLIEAFLIIR